MVRAIGLASSCALLLALAGCSTEREVAPGPPPNIVIVQTDDQDAASVEVMQNVQELLVEQGTTFERYYASFPLCCPSRVTLITGQYAHNHGVLGNELPRGGYFAFRQRAENLGRWLQRAGYVTAWIGKYLNDYGEVGTTIERQPGWSEWQVLVRGIYAMWGYDLSANGRAVSFGEAPRDYQTDVLAERATRFVDDAAGERPFMLVFSPVAPHEEADELATGARNPRPAPRHRGRFADASLPQPPSFNEADLSDKPAVIRRELPPLSGEQVAALEREWRSRLESLLAVDDAVAEIVAALERSGELDETIILFLSDNGTLMGEHRGDSSKGLAYEESVRVPLVIRGPGVPADETRDVLVANADIAPTLLELADARPGRTLDGMSLVEVIENPDAAVERAILLEGRGWKGIRAGDWAYVEHRGGAAELYDLAGDPYQLESLAADPAYAPVREALGRTLSALRDCSGSACRGELSDEELSSADP